MSDKIDISAIKVGDEVKVVGDPFLDDGWYKVFSIYPDEPCNEQCNLAK